MPAATPRYAIPYQQENDPPSGDELGHDLATRVDEIVGANADKATANAASVATKASIADLNAFKTSTNAALATKASLADRNWTNTNVTNLTNVVNRRTQARQVAFNNIVLNAGQAKAYTRAIPAGNTLAVYCTGITNWGVSLVQAHGAGGSMTGVFRNNSTRNLSGVNATLNYLLQ